jgi:hypothetical protein
MICLSDDHRFQKVFQFKVEFVELYPICQFGLNMKTVLFAAFYDDSFVLGYLIWRLEVQVSFMIVHIQWNLHGRYYGRKFRYYIAAIT